MKTHVFFITTVSPPLVVFVLLLVALTPRDARATERGDEDWVVQPPPPRPKTHVNAGLGGGVSAERLFGTGQYTTTLEGGVVMTRRGFGVTGFGHLDLGKSAVGDLAMHEVRLSTMFEWVDGILRLGAGPELSYTWISRASSSSNEYTIDAIGRGLRAHVQLDVLALDKEHTRCVYIAAAPDIAWLRGPANFFNYLVGTAVLRASLTAGVRF